MTSRSLRAVTSSTAPSKMTTSSPLSRWTTANGFAARFSPLREARAVEKKKTSSCQRPQTGAACGRPDSTQWPPSSCGRAPAARPPSPTRAGRRPGRPPRSRSSRGNAAGLPRVCSRRKSLAQALVHDPGIGLAARFLHHLADQEAEHAFLARLEGLHLRLVFGEHLVDDGIQLGRIRDRGLATVVLGGEPGVATSLDCLGECRARDALALGDQLAELGAVHVLRVYAGRRELVHDDVGDRAPVAGNALVEAVAAAGDEPVRKVVADVRL